MAKYKKLYEKCELCTKRDVTGGGTFNIDGFVYACSNCFPNPNFCYICYKSEYFNIPRFSKQKCGHIICDNCEHNPSFCYFCWSYRCKKCSRHDISLCKCREKTCSSCKMVQCYKCFNEHGITNCVDCNKKICNRTSKQCFECKKYICTKHKKTCKNCSLSLKFVKGVKKCRCCQDYKLCVEKRALTCEYPKCNMTKYFKYCEECMNMVLQTCNYIGKFTKIENKFYCRLHTKYYHKCDKNYITEYHCKLGEKD